LVILSLDGSGPLYAQVTRSLRQAIVRGDLQSGLRLPGSRRLARYLSVSRNIVIMAFDQLVVEGYLEPRVGSGTYVAAPGPDRRPPPGQQGTGLDTTRTPQLSPEGIRLVDAARDGLALARQRRQVKYNFEYGLVAPDVVSQRRWRQLLSNSVHQDNFDYGNPAGDPELREAIAGHLNTHRGLSVKPRQVVVVAGAQQALDLIARLFVSPGDTVIVEEPQYQGARQALVAAGAQLLPLRVDHHGLPVPVAISVARLAYITPSHQFPTGVVMPVHRRFELIRWAAATRTLIVEDDYDSEFRYDSRPLQALAGLEGEAPVVYVGTFAKSLFPGLRLGYLVAPTPLAEQLTHAKWLTDRSCPVPLQRALARFMADGDYQRHLSRMRRRYGESRRVLVEALTHNFGSRIVIQGGEAGIHLVVWFPGLSKEQEPALIAAGLEAGCAVYPIAGYYVDPDQRECPGLIMGYSGLRSEAIVAGVGRLATAWRGHLEAKSGPGDS
jgi:GntR family transcriptional regulator/MocR family aminotransferase